MTKHEELALLEALRYQAIRLSTYFNDPEIEEKATELINAIKHREEKSEQS